jgi:cytochrome c oxidase subunit 4
MMIRVWLFLLALTGVEVLLAYLHTPPIVMLAALMGLSLLKAAYIIAYFMHMKFERRSLRFSLFPILVLCILALLMLLPDAARAQCVMCKRTAEAQNAEQARRMNRGILVLAIPPVLIVGAILARAKHQSIKSSLAS